MAKSRPAAAGPDRDADPELPYVLMEVDRKVSAAMANGRGIALTPEYLDALAVVGFLDMLAQAKAQVLKARAEKRRAEAVDRTSNQIGSEASEQDVAASAAARVRARQIFG